MPCIHLKKKQKQKQKKKLLPRCKRQTAFVTSIFFPVHLVPSEKAST